jgi:hypothetical protein
MTTPVRDRLESVFGLDWNQRPASIGIAVRHHRNPQFNLERHIPADHLLRQIDAVLDVGAIRRSLAPYYAATGRPSSTPT